MKNIFLVSFLSIGFLFGSTALLSSPNGELTEEEILQNALNNIDPEFMPPQDPPPNSDPLPPLWPEPTYAPVDQCSESGEPLCDFADKYCVFEGLDSLDGINDIVATITPNMQMCAASFGIALAVEGGLVSVGGLPDNPVDMLARLANLGCDLLTSCAGVLTASIPALGPFVTPAGMACGCGKLAGAALKCRNAESVCKEAEKLAEPVLVGEVGEKPQLKEKYRCPFNGTVMGCVNGEPLSHQEIVKQCGDYVDGREGDYTSDQKGNCLAKCIGGSTQTQCSAAGSGIGLGR